MTSQGSAPRGGWVERHILGSGGFGTVTLWENQESDERIALKRCRLQNEMNAKHRQRWEQEITIMKRLDHPNVIAVRDVPPPLDVGKDSLPLLAMEYCSGGDLRKVLNRPEHCCGLPELQVRFLARDVARAIEYLHGKRIIHRDLKPENIVLQNIEDRIVYKLIDLGYAKELDQGSVCTSFVGTLQYLAPELFASQKYTCTVDYWSFGTVVFECITGIRPFLPSMAPVLWHREVCQKKVDDICAILDSTGKVRFSQKLPTPNHLCRTLQVYFEQWLRMMLYWDPKARGGGIDPDQRRPNCFVLLDNLLEMKIVHVLNVSANQMMSYPVVEKQTLQELQRILSEETKIPVEEQEILLASGITPDPEKPAAQCWSKPGEEDWIVFLFRKSTSVINNNDKQAKPIPLMVQNIIREPNTLLPYQEQRRAWAESVCFCQEQVTDLKTLILAQRAAILDVLRVNTKFLQKKTEMMQDIGQLQAKGDFFRMSLQHDIQRYNDQAASGGITSSSMYAKWKKMGEDLKQIKELSWRMTELDEQARALQTKIVELHKSPFAKSKQTDVLEELTTKAEKLYQDLRLATKEQRRTLSDHSPMVNVVHKCVLVRHKAMADLYTHLGKASSCKAEIKKLLPDISAGCDEIKQSIERLTTNQKQRQNDLWYLVKKALSGVNNQSGASVLRQELKGDISNLPPQSAVSDSSSSGLESLKIIEDNKQTQAHLSNLFDNVLHEHDSFVSSLHDMTWDFLGPSSGDTK
ncbi:inhibitor of nuclear factor kappa-B kinase subunit alpha-like [Liolophura sinensis]|uniref:inhibitor of nuclear factor kappa-B kinase subunit alpha-like n=1 Tax=Liolophura sinensis TaxID=3198878 RepID=UPI0031581611